MSIRKAEATWTGTLKEGSGKLSLGSGHYQGPYTWASRFESGPETNPEELIGAAHSSCYAMFLSALLTKAGFTPERIHATASVHLEAGPTITLIELDVEAKVPGLDAAAFNEHALAAKAACPVSKALASVEIKLNARLV
jgi:osmotically inducible protein OsmC